MSRNDSATRMTARSAKALMWASLVLFVCGGAVGSAEVGLAAATLAALCAFAPAAYGRKWVRVVGVLLLVASAGMAFRLFPDARTGMNAYRNRVHRTPEAK